MQHLRSAVLRAARTQLRRPVAAAAVRAFPQSQSLIQPKMQARLFASRPPAPVHGDDDEDDDDDFDYDDYFGGDDEDEDNKVKYPAPKAFIGKPAPAFTAPAVVRGDIDEISLHDYLGKYVVLFFYPKDFTYVCPTEIIAFNDRAKEFEALDTQLICASTDTPEVHLAWTRTPRNVGGLGKMKIPMVADVTKVISAKYGCLGESNGFPYRGLYVIDREGILQSYTINNNPVGRSVDEALRLVKAFQFYEEHGEVCPANWQPGDATIVDNPVESQKYFKNVK
ncbi:unnamed protein product [Aphanomyces euteiches]|uniref:thioredoxin-dependent peroxiredoxin n=1 Tax=Aphanomyces euteiches TaxID=100861 RepID=A0A6G0XPM6_9STRA|nr:hypothetical protein Ae201684_002544 [Aphanomyces euteiches]KAG9416617.1 Peroxiredoxin-2 [Aphanomyces cochlioides]KAH9092617.1 hypothetical protein Ae201684P_008289 [Aphanomyces euteiches]KAH9146310.1 hypothetical protein AeRB84_009788 [Aphanomyces euteiches]